MKIKSYLPVVAAAFFWGIIGIFVKNLAALSSLQVVAVRVGVSAVCLVGHLLLTNRGMLKIRLRDCWCFVGSGIVGIAFFNWCYFNSIRVNGVSTASILMYTAPAIVTVLSLVLFREKLGMAKAVALLLAVGGILLVSGAGAGGPALSAGGIALGLGSGVGYALYSIFTKYALQRYGAVTATTYTFVFACVGVAPFARVWEIPPLVRQQPAMLAFILGIGVVSSAVPYLCYARALTQIPASQAAIVASLEPVVSTLLGVLVYKETLTALGGLGILLVLASLLVLGLPQRRGRPAKGGGG